MTCPKSEKWLLLSLGELSVNEAGELARHRAACAACRASQQQWERLLEDLRSPAQGELADELFEERVLAACSHVPVRASRPGSVRTARVRALVGGGLAAAAAALLALPWVVSPEQRGRWTARGGGAVQTQASPRAELFFVRDGALRPLESASLTSGDRLLVRYENPGSTPAFMLVFALDAAGEVHWIYPAYLDPAQDPESIPIAARSAGRALDEVVEPDGPAEGSFRVFAVFSAQPLKVRAVEARLGRRRDADVAAEFEAAYVQQWSTRWTQ